MNIHTQQRPRSKGSNKTIPEEEPGRKEQKYSLLEADYDQDMSSQKVSEIIKELLADVPAEELNLRYLFPSFKTFLKDHGRDRQKNICSNPIRCIAGSSVTLGLLDRVYGPGYAMAYLVHLLDMLFCHVNPDKAPDGKLVGTVAEYISEHYQDMQTDETLLFFHYLESGLFGKVKDMHEADQFISALDEYFRHTDIVIKDYMRRRSENIRRFHSENGSLSSPSLGYIPTSTINAAAVQSAMTAPAMPSIEG